VSKDWSAHDCLAMPHDPHAEFDQNVLEMIEHSPVGALPNTPSYQDALLRLSAAHQVYAHADYEGGHVTARSLAARPVFFADNLNAFATGQIDEHAIESNASIFTRYVQSLPTALRDKAESFRANVAVPPPRHRAKLAVTHDPLHTICLVPGTGRHHGLPGNYLHGSLLEMSSDSAPPSWAIHLHDCDDGAAMLDAPTLAAAVAAVRDLLECAPFHLEELEALGFRLN